MTINMINKAVDHGVKHIVLVSAWTTPFNPKMPMTNGRFKPPEDFLVDIGKRKEIAWTVLRAGFFMDNCLYMLKDSVKDKSLVNFPNVHIPMRDIGKSAAACLASTNGEYNRKFYDINGIYEILSWLRLPSFVFNFFFVLFVLQGPELLSGSDLAEKFSKVLGREIKFNELSRETVNQAFPPYVADIFNFIFDNGRREEAHRTKRHVRAIHQGPSASVQLNYTFSRHFIQIF